MHVFSCNRLAIHARLTTKKILFRAFAALTSMDVVWLIVQPNISSRVMSSIQSMLSRVHDPLKELNQLVQTCQPQRVNFYVKQMTIEVLHHGPLMIFTVWCLIGYKCGNREDLQLAVIQPRWVRRSFAPSGVHVPLTIL